MTEQFKTAVARLKRRYRFPLVFDGYDLLAAPELDGACRVIVWGKENGEDRDDISEPFGYTIAVILNELVTEAEPTS